MGSEWKDCELGDVIEFKRGYDLPKTIRGAGDIPVISSSGKSGFHNEFKVMAPGVVTGRYGTIGEVFYLDTNFWPLNTTLYVCDFKGNDPLFIYYFLKTISYSDFIDKAAVPGINRNHIHKAKVKVPKNIDCQQKIAKTLKVLDNKISLNNQINQTLEQMAQTLFKSWFVDFDPVIDNALDAGFFEQDLVFPEKLLRRAEARKVARENSDFKSLPEDIRKLFPEVFEVHSDTSIGINGWIPKGWFITSLDHIANFQNGLALQKFRPDSEEDEYLPVLKIAQLRQGYCDHNEKARTDIKESCRVYDGDMIFSWSGTLMIDIWTGGNAALNQHLYKVTSDDYPLSFYFHWTNYHLARFQHIAASKAVTMGHIKKGDLSDSLCIIPSNNILIHFDNIVSPYFKQSKNVRLQCNVLTKLRDTLLPKLISGELSLSDINIDSVDGALA